jgi:hypothetical protein
VGAASVADTALVGGILCPDGRVDHNR